MNDLTNRWRQPLPFRQAQGPERAEGAAPLSRIDFMRKVLMFATLALASGPSAHSR